MKRGVLLSACAVAVLGSRASVAESSRCPVEECAEQKSANDKALCDPEDWALRQIGLKRLQHDERLRHLSHLTGRGVVIGHIDTGYTSHPALPRANSPSDPGIYAEGGYNFMEACRDPRKCGVRDLTAHSVPAADPLKRVGWVFDRQPGHGTSTAGIIVADGTVLGCSGSGHDDCESPPRPCRHATPDRRLSGIAPGAQVIPFRVSDGSILTESRSARLVKAILGAALAARTEAREAAVDGRRPTVDVISISFGRRSPDEKLEQAVELAERHGIIIVAASGEMPAWSPVRFPARYPNVIGVTGTKVDGTPWSGVFGAGRGREAFIAAPAEKVWIASTRRIRGRERYSARMGSGTSFSAPMVAAAAALWIERWTWEALAEKYGVSGIPAAFRYMLYHDGVRHPEELCALAQEEGWPNANEVCRHRRDKWDLGRFGGGILAIDRLLETP